MNRSIPTGGLSMSRSTSVIAFNLAALLVTMPGTSGAFQILSGKWRVEAEIRNPLTQQPQVKTSIACIERNSFDPTVLMMQEGNCAITDKQDSGSRISWKFQCNGQAQGIPPSSGTASLVSHGRTASGVMQVAMVFSGQTLALNSKWRGEHLSSRCD